MVDKDSSNVRGEKCAQIDITIQQNLIAFVTNISTRVIAQKSKREQEKKWAMDRVPLYRSRSNFLVELA